MQGDVGDDRDARPPGAAAGRLVLGSERADPIELPAWQEGLADYLAARERERRRRMKLLVDRRRRLHRLDLRAPPPRDHPDDSVRVLDKLTYAGRRENLEASTRTGSSWSTADIADRDAVGRGDRGLRRGRQLRRRVPRRPLDRGAGRVHPHRRLRHLRAARGGARARRPPPAGLHRRGLRLDRDGLVHRDLAARPLLALLGVEGRRRPARRRLSHTPTAPRR